MKTWITVMRTRTLVVRMHYTWLLVLALGSWALGQVVLPARLGPAAGAWLPALLIMVVYIGIVMLHEAAHLLVARLLRVPMPALNVHPIGTLARLGSEAAGPGRTFAVAAAGPLANLLLWLVLRAMTAIPGTLAGETLNFARSMTLTLGVVNLLPGLPLDGGRLLRALVWSGSDFAAGTRIATIGGYIVAAGTLVVGLFSVINPATTLRGIWMLLLAWLIYAAGTMLTRRRAVSTLFTHVTARDVLVPAQQVTAPQQTLRDLVAGWRGGTGENPTPVIEDGRLVGLITRSLASDVPQGYWDERTVGDTMQPLSDMATIAPTTPLSAVLPQLDPNEFYPLPLFVADDGRLLGLINPRDLLPFLDVQDVLGLQQPAAPQSAEGAMPARRFALGKQHGSLS